MVLRTNTNQIGQDTDQNKVFHDVVSTTPGQSRRWLDSQKIGDEF